jgi:hypothetical protein
MRWVLLSPFSLDFYFFLYKLLFLFLISSARQAKTQRHTSDRLEEEFNTNRGRSQSLFFLLFQLDGYRCSACQHTRHRPNKKKIIIIRQFKGLATPLEGIPPFTRRNVTGRESTSGQSERGKGGIEGRKTSRFITSATV